MAKKAAGLTRLTRDDRRYLHEYLRKAHRKGTSGWVDPIQAGKGSGIDPEGGNLAIRLSLLGYLQEKPRDASSFGITSEGRRALRPWWLRHPAITVMVVLTIIGWALAIFLAVTSYRGGA